MPVIEPSTLKESEIEAIVRDTVRRIEALAAERGVEGSSTLGKAAPARRENWFPAAAITFGQCSIFGICLVALVSRFVADAEIGNATACAGIAVGTLMFAFVNPTPFFKKSRQ